MTAPLASTAFVAEAPGQPAAAGGLAVDVVGDGDALLRLQPEWDRLLESSGIEHPFLSHEWIRTWWECFGRGNELRVVRVRDPRGALVGLLPLMWSREFRYGLPVRRLGSLYNPHTPRSGALVAPGVRGVAEAIWRYLSGSARDWDVLELCQLPGDDAALEALCEQAATDGFLTGDWQARPSPFLPIRGSWEEYCRGFSSKHRSSIRRRMDQLGEHGEVALELVAAAAELPAALEDGYRIEAAAWKGAAGTAIGARPELRLFYTRLAERAAARGWLALQFLTVGGRRIGFGYSLRYRNRLHLLKPGYDPAYARYSPGNTLIWLTLRQAFDQGLVEYDFLGVDDPWKLTWTPQARAHCWRFVFAPSLRGRWLHAAKFRLAPALRRWHA